MGKRRFKKQLSLLAIVLLLLPFLLGPWGASQTRSANLTNVSVTLSNSRLSFHGILAAGNTAGSSIVTINTSGTTHKTSKSTAQLQEGDSVLIGDGGTATTYTVDGTNPASEFTTTVALGSGDADENDDVIATQSSTLTVRFTTASAVADGLPDSDKFDFSTTPPTVTCPGDETGYDFIAGTASASAITVSGADYHAFECAYSGAGGVTNDFDGGLVAGGNDHDAITIAGIINPSPESDHVVGASDDQTIIVQHFDSAFAVQDTTTVAVGEIEAVKVTATIDPSISFTIAAVNSAVSSCGVDTDVTTTTSSVPFGTLSLSAFIDASQTLTVSTNAANGYAVTAKENDQLGLAGAACTGDNTGSNCIRDTAGDTTTMTHIVTDEWVSTSTKGFAYSIDNDDATTPAFEYTTTTGGCDGAFCAKQFADVEDSQVAQTVFGAAAPADSQNVNVCYRIIPSITNSAGDYENYITYTATATF